MYAKHPKVCRKWTSGLLLCEASYGVILSTALVGTPFSRKIAVATASPQNIAGMFRLFSRLRAMVMTV